MELFDYSQVELKVLASLNEEEEPEMNPALQQAMEKEKVFRDSLNPEQRRLYKALKFAETYGSSYNDPHRELAERMFAGTERKTTVEYLKRFPALLPFLPLRKSRSRMMVEAIRFGMCERGNHKVRLAPEDPNTFIFSYRGTDILLWDTKQDVVKDIHAGSQYEHTPSTRNQRKMAREAIDEFRRVVFAS